jgi:hypothetical protein
MNARLRETQKAPLRKIIRQGKRLVEKCRDSGQEIIGQLEVLECGHKAIPRSDIFGETNASRRRCRKCLKETVPARLPKTENR